MKAALLAAVLLGASGAAFAADPLSPALSPKSDEPTKIDINETNRVIGVLIGDDNKAAMDLVGKIETQPGDYTPPAIIFMADRLFRQGDHENAYFWFCFGRLRFLYDAERCADVTARASFGEMMNSIKPDLRHYPTTMNPDEIVPFAKRVLHLDSVTSYSYDLHWINLHGKEVFSSNSGRPLSVPEAQWDDIHRKICNDYLVGAEGMADEMKNQAANK